MGYESKLIVILQTSIDLIDGRKDYINQTIAIYDCCKLGYDFNYKIFTDKIKGNLYIPFVDDDEKITEDRYGDELKATYDIDKLIKELARSEKASHYRRLPPLINMLKALRKAQKNKEWGDLLVVHYGY